MATEQELEEIANPTLPVTPYQIPEEPGMLSALHDTLFDPAQTMGTDVSGIPQVDVGIPPLDPTQITQPPGAIPVTPQDVAQARAHNDQLGVSPETVDKVVGKTTTATSQQTESQATKDAAADLEQASVASKAASQLEMEAADKQGEIEAKTNQESNEVISHVENARALAQQDNRAKFEQDIRDIDDKFTELKNYKPETFWGSKDTADKIASALSIGLGSFGQALLGSGQNVGMVLLQRKMDEFDRNQQTIYNAKLKEIEGMKVSFNMKRQLAQDAEKTFDATKLAGIAQVQSVNAKGAAMAKTMQTKAGIAQRQTKLDADMASKQAEIAAKYEAKSTTTNERDVIEKVKLTAGMGKDGKPLKLTDKQADARVALSSVVTANQSIGKLDPKAEYAMIMSSPYQQYLSDSRKRNSLGSTGGVGKAVGGLWDVLNGSPAENLANGTLLGANADPAAAKYEDAAQAWTRGVIRYKSGAAIAHQEQQDERDTYWPVIGDSPDILARKRKSREELEVAMREAGGL